MPATIFGLAWAKALVDREDIGDDQEVCGWRPSILALPWEAAITSSVFGDQPTQPLSRGCLPFSS